MQSGLAMAMPVVRGFSLVRHDRVGEGLVPSQKGQILRPDSVGTQNDRKARP